MKRWLWLLLALPLLGRDLYLWPSRFIVSPGERVTVRFNQGETIPQSTDSIDMNLLRDFNLLSPYASYTVERMRVERNSIVGRIRIPRRGELLLTARTNPTTAGQGRSQEFAKAILFAKESSDQYRRVVGFALEIVPQQDPYSIHAEGFLPVEVLWHGKPAPGVSVDAAHTTGKPASLAVAGKTGSDGRIRIPISAAGDWCLRAVVHEPGVGSSEDVFRTSLTFAVR